MAYRGLAPVVALPNVRDIRDFSTEAGWFVGAWFTPDYEHWTVPFRASLERVGAPYHILACASVGDGWEAETMQKPRVVRRLLDANPGKTLVLLDVDCEVRSSPARLVDSIKGDVAAYVRAKRQGPGKERSRIKVMSGTMVFRPTEGARRFLDAWEAAGAECDAHDVDQTSLMIAMGRATDFTFQPLSSEWCDFEGLNANPAIVHANASQDSPKATWMQRHAVKIARAFMSDRLPAKREPRDGSVPPRISPTHRAP